MKTLYTTYNNFAKRLVMTLMVLMTVGVGSVLGAEYEEMLTLDVAKNAPTGSTSTQLTINEIESYLQNAAPNTSNIKSASDKTGDVYKGKGNGGEGIPQQCLKIGKASGPGGFTFTIADSFDDIAKVDIIGYGWKTTSNISVNNATAQNPTTAASLTTFSFELAKSTKTITISVTTSAVCVTSIKLYKAAPSGYAVTWDKNGRGDVSDVSKFPTTASSLTLQSLSATGYTNTGWKANVDVKNGSNTIKAEELINNGTIVTLLQATTFTAQWSANKYTVNFTASPNGYGSVTQSKIDDVPYGTVVTSNSNTITINDTKVTATPAAKDANYSYSFNNWTGIPSGNNVTANCTITANFTRTERALTNYRTSCGLAAILESITVSGQTTTYNVGDSFSFDGTCTATYNDESTKTVTPTSISSPDMSTAGTKTVTVTYTENDVTVTTTYDITVNVVKTATSLTWSADSYTATIASESNVFPTLTITPEAIKGSVTYSSSHPEYATIDAAGNIRLLAAGTTTITASYAGDEDYAAAEDTYTLTVEESTNCRWEEVTDLNDIATGDEVVITMTKGNYVWTISNEKHTSNTAPTTVDISANVEGQYLTTVNDGNKWVIEKNNDNLTFYSYTDQDNYLYCTNADNGVRVGTGDAKEFVVDGNYLKNTQTDSPRYIGVSLNTDPYSWRCYTVTTGVIKAQTLKLYKKECLPANEYWVDYELANVVYVNTPPHSQIANDGEDLLLEFVANDGYKLPESISVSIGNNVLPADNDVYTWDNETGELLIKAAKITDNVTISITGCERLQAPTNLQCSSVTSSSATLSWDPVPNADNYTVYVTDGGVDINESTDGCTITITELTPNTLYTWDVIATATNYCENEHSKEWIEFTTHDVYTVTFNSNGGTAVEPQTVDEGSKITAPANPSAAGYTFNYWYTTDANDPFDFNTPITGNTTLNAKWTPNVYTITFYKQSGTGGTDNATVTFNSNNYSVSTIEAPTREKYAFGGYYTEQYGAGIQVVDAEGNWLKNVAGYTDANGNWIKAENTHLYAKWTAIYTITWVVNNNTETPYHTSTVLSGSTIDQLPTPPANNLFADCDVNAFVGWSTDNIGFDPDPTAPTDLFKTVAEAQNKIGAISADKKFYAVYASASNGADSYKLATKVEDLFDGQTVIIAKDNGALERDNNTIDKVNISPDGNGNLSNVTDNIKWTLEASDTHWKLNNNGGYLGVTSTANQTAVSVTETNNVWQIAKSTASGDYFYICQPNTTIGLQYYNSRWQIYSNNSVSSSTNFTLKIYVPNVTNFITRCTALPDPVWGGATIDNAVIPVNCGSTTSNSHAAQISFPAANNYNLYKDITVEASSGFVLSTSRDAVEYQTSVTLSPTQSNTNAGTFANKYVYVRAVAPAMSDEDFTGTITISGQQIATQTITVTADVTCTQYTLTFNDQGQTKTVSGFAGTTVETPEPWAGICTEPIQYVFDGWAETPVANDTEEYEKIDFSAYTMPDNNTTVLYAVYRYAKEGGEPVDGFVKVTEALSDWTGDYVIVDDENLFAIKNAYRENTNSNKTLAGETVTIENDKVVSPSANIVWSFSKNGNGYTMYSDANKMYAGVTGNSTTKAILSSTTDANSIFTILFDNETQIAKVSAITYTRCFRYYESGDVKEWRTYDSNQSQYNTGYLYRLSEKTLRYTSSLVCGSIEAENAIVTSTVGQIVKVNVPITLKYSDAASITGTSDNEAFTVVTKNDVAVGESNIEVHYKPTAYVNTANQEETATITLTTSNGATTSFNITGRCLPESFVIAAKWGENWYALPANMSSTDSKDGMLIDVDDSSDPIKAKAAPSSAQYSLKSVKPGKFANQGERLVFVGNEGKTLYNAEGTSIQVFAQYENYDDDRYEWVPTTTDLKDYILTSAYTFSGDAAARTISLDKHGVFGTLLQDKSYNGMVRLLPVDEFYTPTELQVVEWKANSVSIMYTGAGTKATTKVGNSESAVQLLSDKKIKIDHAVYTLATSDLTAATNQVLTISIKDDAENTIGTLKLTIPWIVSDSESSTSRVASEVAQATDIVVLDGATLTADDTKYTYNDVVVYPGGKLVIGTSGKLGMYSLTLRLGSSWGAAEYEHKYPEFVLNTKADGAYSNTSGKINLDYVTTKSQYYTFVAPFEVKTKDIKYPVDIYGSNVEAANRGSFEFQYYDGAARAAGEKGWKVVEEDPTDGATLTAHKGYTFYGMPKKVNGTRQKFGIHRIPMSIGAATVMEHENTAQTTAVSAYPSEHNINAGWNLIGNPYMSTITGLNNESIQTGTIVLVDDRWQWSNEADQYNHRFIVFPSNDGEWYYTSQASNATLPAFKNFFVQIGKEVNTLSIPRNIPQAQLLAPIRHTDEEVEHDIEMAIVLEKDDAYSDQLDFLLNDEYGAGFDHNADFTKMMNNTNLNLYGVHWDDKLSFVAIDHFTARAAVEIGYQVPSAGEYTLRISDKPYVMLDKIEALYVTDHEMNPAVTTNLMEEDYVFHVGKAEINDTRFTISLSAKANNDGDDVTTDMGEVDIHNDLPQKFFYDGKLYILREGKVYSATGHEIKTINK